MSSPASRSASSESIALRSVAASLAVLLGVVFIAACSSQRTRGSDVAQTEPDPNLPTAPGGQAKPGGPDSVQDQGVRIARRASAGPQELDSRYVVGYDAMQRDMAVLRFSSAPWQTERYDSIEAAGFLATADRPLSTFSIDVDTASYSNVRRFLLDGSIPPEGAVRIEELVNYFQYPSETRAGEHPFTVETEVFEAPWTKSHRLVRIAVHGREIAEDEIPPLNLVFLLDVSGSMQGADRLGLVRRGLTGLIERLRPEDRVAIVVYAGASGLLLPSTPGDQRRRIQDALDELTAGGSTHGAAGIRLAYDTARAHFDAEGINRVILATDGDFNVGVTSRSELVKLIEKERQSGVFLTVLGFGRGNLNDAGMQELADKGNGHYAYIDSIAEARKVLVHEAGGTLVTIAKDVKIQVEFNPMRVAAYRLIGYENRRLEDRDFNDDEKDAGEIGAGHDVTALYEIVPVGVDFDSGVDPLKYQKPAEPNVPGSGDWLTVKLRYKAPQGSKSQLAITVLDGSPRRLEETTESGRFTAAVALFGMLLRDSDFKGEGDFDLVRSLARGALGEDPRGERAEFIRLVALAEDLGS